MRGGQFLFEAKPDAPDPDFARKMQEVLGGPWGEMTVATQYLLQGWNCRLPGKYKDLLLAIGTAELAHVETIVAMIDRLLDHVPLKPDAADRSREAAAGYGQRNPQHAIVNGAGASYIDSMGNPWTGSYVTASGNLMADFHYNVTAEMQGRLQVAHAAVLLSVVNAAAVAVALTAPGAHGLAGIVVLTGLVARWALRHPHRATVPQAVDVVPTPATPA